MPWGDLLRNIFKISTLVVLVLFLFSSLTARADNDKPLLVIFHTSDGHGQILEQRNPEGQLTNIGYARLKGYVDSYPAPAKMLVDAGDTIHGTPFAFMSRGGLMALLLQALNYDALAVGRSEFEYGLPRLMELYDTCQLNYIAANILEKEDGIPIFPPYIVRNFGDLKVGIFGLTSPKVALQTLPDNIGTVDIGTPDSLVDTTAQMVKWLKNKEKVDLVVALTHLGTTEGSLPKAQDLAKKVPGINLIIDGYSHYPVSGLKVGATLITSAGNNLENLGQVTVSRKNGALVLSVAVLEAAKLENVKPDPQVEALVNRLSALHQQELNQVVGTSPIDLDVDLNRPVSTSFGRILAASMARASRSQVAMINNGALGVSLPAGDITRGQLSDALPVNSQILEVRLTGAEIIQVLRQSLLNTSGGYLQFYGLSAIISEVDKIQGDGSTIRQTQIEAMDIDGRPLELDTEYTVAINDSIYAGGHGYSIFSNRPMKKFSNLYEGLLNFLSTAGADEIENIAYDTVLEVIVEETVSNSPARQAAD